MNTIPRKKGRWRKFARIVLLGVAILLSGVVAVYVWSMTAPLTQRQREALDLLQRQPPLPGRNAFAALWLLDLDAPSDETELQAAASADVRSYADRLARTRAGSGKNEEPIWTAPSAAKFGKLFVPQEGDPPWCKPEQWPECLRQVGADPAAYDRLLDRYAALSNRIEALAHYDRYESEFPPGAASPIPKFQILFSLPSTQQARLTAQGNAALALELGCRTLRLGTMLATRSRDLLSGMIGAKLIVSQAPVLAWIMATHPEQPVPQTCLAATAALPIADFDLCPHLYAEWQDYRAEMLALEKSGSGRNLLFDADKTSARFADAYAEACREPARQRLLQDMPATDSAPASSPLASRECVANLIGCMLSDISRHTFAGYQNRLQDAYAARQALRSLVWLRAQPPAAAAAKNVHDSGLAELFGRRPDEMRTPTQRTSIAMQENGAIVLRVALYDETLRRQLQADDLQLPVVAPAIDAASVATR